MRLERILAALKAGQPVVHRTTRRAIKHVEDGGDNSLGGIAGTRCLDFCVVYADTDGPKFENVDSRDIVRPNFRGDNDVAEEIKGAIIDVLNDVGIDGPLPPISVEIDISGPPFFMDVKSIHESAGVIFVRR